MLGTPGSLPEVYVHLEVKYFLLRRLLGVKAGAEDGEKSKSKGNKVKKLDKDEILMVSTARLCRRRRRYALGLTQTARLR